MPKTNLTFDIVRQIGLELPDVEEGTMYGSPALKLGGRLVTCLAVHKSAEPGTLVVRTDFEERTAMLAEDPQTYYLTDHYVNHPVVLVRLSRIQIDQLRGLLISARRFVKAHQSRTGARSRVPRKGNKAKPIRGTQFQG